MTTTAPTTIVVPTRVYAIDERQHYPTVVIDRWEALKCAAPCNNDIHGSGFDFANEMGTVVLPPEADITPEKTGIYVCLGCGIVIDIAPVPAWDPAQAPAAEAWEPDIDSHLDN
ncbi:hypothetical protein [Planomonospora sp. ID82291]|uniref:hypothetical protein n=1 Tax=Planomonospora sp. ID82291 TaxID=2738136 RepID=UPI0018C389B6|nr:hypothetical protein [Planomonospora sp. ID82291]MBG0818919.1 hypothetical protein [Planomonospora sp. ID82291]